MKNSVFAAKNWLGAAVMFAALLIGNMAWAQSPLAKAALAFTYTFSSSDGTNASAVTYVPGPNVYITCIAGNSNYPLEVFNREGKTISTAGAGIDLRGIWYNPATNSLEGNCAGEEGWFSTPLNAQGIPSGDWSLIRQGQLQPDFQSVMSYITPKKKLVTITADNSFSFWGRKNGKEKVCFQHGTPGDTDWYFNPYSAAYTGNDAFPLAVLELNGEQILYFSLKGQYLGATKIDGGLPEMDGFRFSFANRNAFVYDESARTWSAYRVF